MKNVRQVLLIVGLAVCTVQFAQARPVRVINSGGNGTTSAPASKAVPFWTVDALDQEGKTVTLTKSDGKETQKYKLTAMTKITINGQPDKVENVQPGMKAENMMVSAGTLSALSLVKVKESEGGGKKNKNKNN